MVARFQDRVRGGGSYVQVRASVDRATAYRIPVLFPHNNVIDNGAGDEIRGFMSELGLAQSEDSFQLSSTTKLKTNKRTVTSRVDCLLETVFSISRQEKGSGRQEDLERGLQQGTSGRFTTRTEDLCTVHRDL